MKDESQPALSVVNANGARPETATRSLPGNIAVKCPNCRELLVGKDWEKNLKVCPKCGHHGRLAAHERLEQLLDSGSFEELAADLRSNDPLHFSSRAQVYREKLESERQTSGLNESLVAGCGTIEELPLAI